VFGTTGIRKKFAVDDLSESTFTPSIALRIGLAIGTYIKAGTVVVGRDIRTAALPIELALTSGLVSTGCRVLSIGMVTTPTLAMSIDNLDADCGIMITASHNPPEYIGVKLWNKGGLGFVRKQEAEIEEIFKNRAFEKKEWNELGSVIEIKDINRIHVDEVLKRITIPKNARKFGIILDPGNGSSCQIAPLLINRMGFRHITLNSQPDGTFPGRLSEPSSKNLQDIIDFVKIAENIELGIALDGDADRVIFIEGNGHIVDPIRILTFLAKEYITEHPPKPGEKPVVVTPINSSGVIEAILEPLGIEIVRTQIGDIKVSIGIKEHNAFLGGETAGTYIWPQFHLGPDSLMTIAMLIKYLSQYDKPLTELLKDIPEFPFIQSEYDLEKDQEFTQELYQHLLERLEVELKKEGYTNIKKSMVDGVQLIFDQGWTLVRKSGTTPMVRINAESRTDMEATLKIQHISEKVVAELVPISKKIKSNK
jgi:phosphoglucosamine mutase